MHISVHYWLLLYSCPIFGHLFHGIAGVGFPMWIILEILKLQRFQVNAFNGIILLSISMHDDAKGMDENFKIQKQ